MEIKWNWGFAMVVYLKATSKKTLLVYVCVCRKEEVFLQISSLSEFPRLWQHWRLEPIEKANTVIPRCSITASLLLPWLSLVKFLSSDLGKHTEGKATKAKIQKDPLGTCIYCCNSFKCAPSSLESLQPQNSTSVATFSPCMQGLWSQQGRLSRALWFDFGAARS